MDLEEIKKLPAEDQKKELARLRESFGKEREDLKTKIRDLESLKKEKEALVKGLATAEKKETLAEVSLIIGSIKNVRNEIEGRNKELEFLGQALKQTEKLLKSSEEETQKQEEEEKKLDIILTLLRRETERRDLRRQGLIETIREETPRGREGSALEESLDEEEVHAPDEGDEEGKEETNRKYVGRGDLPEQTRPYIPEGTARERLEASERQYHARHRDELQPLRDEYKTHVPSHDNEYVSQRRQEEIQEANIRRKTSADEALEEREEFIQENLKKEKRHNTYER